MGIMVIMDGEFGVRMQHALELAGMNQIELSNAIGVSKQTVNKWCNSHNHDCTAHAADIYRAAQVLRVDLGWLSAGVGEPRPKQRLTIVPPDIESIATQIMRVPEERRRLILDLANALKD